MSYREELAEKLGPLERIAELEARSVKRGPLNRLHDIYMEFYEELHRLDGTDTGGYSLFRDPKLEEAAATSHAAYSLVAEVLALRRRNSSP